MKKVEGVAISKGIVIGNIFVLEEKFIEVKKTPSVSLEFELKTFQQARNKSIKELEKIQSKMLEELGEEEASIFGAHIELIQDFEFVGQVEEEIKTYECSAQWAVQTVGNRLIAMFEGMDNAYFRERAADIKDITQRILKNIVAKDDEQAVLQKPSIIVAKDLSPSETSSLDKDMVIGIITEIGGKTSHSAIIARLLGIPFVVVKHGTDMFKQNDYIILDGSLGEVILEPEEAVVCEYELKIEELNKEKVKYEKLKGLDSVTADHIKINLMANIGSTDDLKYVVESDAMGIGLFRTEFIFMDNHHLPTEEQQFKIYKEVLESQKNLPVTFRTLDIGGDKENPLFKIPKEMNPFLGLRGIRLCFVEVDIFKNQLKAILRACQYGNGKIMFPMISTMEELILAKDILEKAKEELRELNISFNEKVPIGMMMETPSATLRAQAFAKEVDFFSIGTNDLIQYTLAVDRMNNSVAELYSQYDPAILASVYYITEAAKANNISVSVCGESAADPVLTPFWISIGVDTLSMTANAIAEVKWTLSKQKAIELRKLRSKWLEFRTKNDVLDYLQSL